MPTAHLEFRHFNGKTLLTTASLITLLITAAQAQYWNWTWMKGSHSPYSNGTYGTVLVEDSANTPGARKLPVEWHDNNGDFWLFGGNGFSTPSSIGNLNDLWKYDISSGNWTWMKGNDSANQGGVYGSQGIAAVANIPGGRVNSVSWIDRNGDLWLFGGYGQATSSSEAGPLNDLWKYDVSSGNWAWMKGSQLTDQLGIYGTIEVENSVNCPGSRTFATGWIDRDDNLWLFGGLGYAATEYGYLNDLWKYDVNSGSWTWMKGSMSQDQMATYGTRGVASALNTPSSRYSSGWVDNNNDFWLFGGAGFISNSTGLMNEMWKYDPDTNNWVWMKGEAVLDQTGTYGTIGVESSSNTPGARQFPATWTDSSGGLWLFAGNGYSATTEGYLNDVWKFNVNTNNWTWMNGSNVIDQNGLYGTILVEDPTNSPGARDCCVGWADNSDSFWIFGGTGYAKESSGFLNDLWRLQYSSLIVEFDYFMVY